MDDADPSAATSASSSHEASIGAVSCDLESPSKKNRVQEAEDSNEESNESADGADVMHIMQSPSSSGPALIDQQIDEAMSEGQYIPLVQLMVPPPSGPPPRPPPPSIKPKNVPKGQKGKSHYHQLAENVAIELASMNERLHQKLRSSFEKLQAKEQLSSDVQPLGEVEEDSYVFVNQQSKY